MDTLKTKIFINRLRSIVYTIFNRLENNNNADFHTNGEEHFLHNLFASLHGEIVVFDVGANVGKYSDILVKICAQSGLQYTIHTFEPTSSSFSVLQKKFADDPHVRLNNFGVSDTTATADIFYDAEQSEFASLYQRDLTVASVTMNKSETISLIRLDDYINENSIQGIDYFKIDVEGHELAAFRGLGPYLHGEFMKAIQFEYGGANLDSKTTLRETYALLEKRGFVIAKVMKSGIEIRPYDLKMENYQFGNYVALSRKYFPDLP